MGEEEIKRKLAQASVSTAVSAKAWGEGEAGGRRRLMHCRERRGGEKREGGQEKVKSTMSGFTGTKIETQM